MLLKASRGVGEGGGGGGRIKRWRGRCEMVVL